MSKHRQDASSSQKGRLPWWILLCRRLWKLTAFLGISVILSLTVNVASTWLTSSKGALPADAPLSTFLTHWPAILLIGCCLLLIAALTWVISRWNIPSEETPPPTAQDRERMLRRLRFRYEQMLAQSLQGTVQVELGLISRSAAVQNAAALSLHLPDQPDQAFAPGTSLLHAYEVAQQDLLILGEPGAGKSTLLLELAHHLITRAERDTTQPFPVLLPLSSWAESHSSLADWLIEQFAQLYEVPRKLSQQWVSMGMVIPLLDGLDEMEEASRADCIIAINTYHREHLHPLTVCSRTNEYEIAARQEKLALHTAVIAQPLLPTYIETRLATLGKPLAALCTVLRKNHDLQEIVTTPLMLQIFILAYHGTLVQQLAQKGPQLRQQIWMDYVQRMIRRNGDEKRYPLDTTTKWLSWLARQMRMHNQTIFSLEHLQPDWLPKKQRAFSQRSVGLLAGLLPGLSFGLFALHSGLLLGVLVGLISMLSFWLPLELFYGQNTKIELTEALSWSWKLTQTTRRILIAGLPSALLAGLLVWLIRGQQSGLETGLSLLLFLLLIFLPLDWLSHGLSRVDMTKRFILSPNEGIRRTLQTGLFVGLLVGLLFGLLFGLLSWLFPGEPQTRLLVGLQFGLQFGLFIGLLFGLLFGLHAALRHYTLRFWLWRTHAFPFRAVPFLEDATARILLRRVGGGYCFTHRLLLDHFADMDTTTLSTSSLVDLTLSSSLPESHP